MGQIVIFRNGSAHLNLVERGKVTINDATFNRAMLSDDSVNLKVNSSSVLDIKVNDYFTLFGENYRINQLPTFTKNSNSSYEYQIVAQGLMYDLLRCKFFNADGEGFKTTLDFPLIGNLELFLTVIANNMKRFSDKWEFKSYPFQKGETKTLTFGSDTCLSALQKICQEFKTDFWVKSENGKFVIHTGDFGNNIPVTFEYGKGNGLYALSRSNVNEEGVINRMYVEGSSENLPNNYRNFSDRLKFSDAGYLEDANLIAEMGLKEGELKLDDIYPSRTGKVTALGATKFKFIDNTMDFDLNEKEADGITTKYLKPDTTAKIHFNTGNLAGYEFEIKKGGYKHATKEFEIIPITTTSGQKIPDLTSEAFQFGVGDEYVLIDIYAPEIYITNAENKLLAKATEQFALKKQVEVSYDLIVDPEFIKKLQTKINVGDYVRVKDAKLGVDKVIRVNSIAQNFIKGGEWRENDYKISIADSYEISYASQMILDIREIKNVNNITNQGEINYSLIGMKNTRELQSMVFDTDGYFDPVNIKPHSIETNMLTVGSQSQQLSCSVVFRVNADGLKNKIVSEAGKLFSQTFNKTWDIPALTFNVPDDVARYVYVKCSKTGTAGSVLYDSAQRKFDEDPNDFYFLVGILHSVVEGMRVLSITIGTTTINGGLVRTGVISSLDGQTTFNLNTGEFKGKFTFANGTNVQTAVENAQNAANGSVKTVDVEYYLSNSATVLSGGTWMTIAPAWVNGKYMWSRTKTTLVNGNITYTPSANGVCIAGAAGTSGTPGKGITSITENYYLSTSKTMQIGGQWTNTPPTWVPNTYLWTRSTIVWNNPTSTTTTPPIVDSSWEAVNNIQIGGRNFLLNSEIKSHLSKWFAVGIGSFQVYNNEAYVETGGQFNGIAQANAVALDENSDYTISFKIKFIDNSGGQNLLIGAENIPNSFVDCSLFPADTNGWKKVSYTKKSTTAGISAFLIFGTGGVQNFYIKDLKIEKGNKATDWTPAPEDVDASIAVANANSATALAQAQNAQTTAAAAAAVTNFMQTTVDGNVVSTGTLQVGDAVGANAFISGVTDKPNGESIRFAAGKPYTQKQNSPFQVLDNGMVRFVNPMTGQKTFELGFNQNTGKVVFDIYNDTGVKVATIGPSGISFTGFIPESYEPTQFRKLNTGTFTNEAITAELTPLLGKLFIESSPPSTPFPPFDWAVYEILIKSNYNCFYYKAGRNFESAGNAQYEGYYVGENKFGNKVPNGIYAVPSIFSISIDTDGSDGYTWNTVFKYSTEVFVIQNGIITNSMEITISKAISTIPTV